MAVDRLEVQLAREHEVVVAERRIPVGDGLQRVPHGILDEARLKMRVLDDEQLVRALEKLVHRGAHRPLDDVDEVLGVDLGVRADEERALPALVVRRERDELEDAVDVAFAEACLEQPLGCCSAHEALRARAGVDAPRFHPDDAADAVGRRGRDADQRRDLLGREVRDGRAALERVLRFDPHLGAQCVLALDDVACNVLRERLDEERLPDHDGVDRLAEKLREARHVDALLLRVEVDRAGDLGGEGLLVALVPDPDRLLHPGHPGPRQTELDLGRRGLHVGDGAVPGFGHRVEP